MAQVEYTPPQSVKELLERYEAGERDFSDVTGRHVNLSGANLRGADLRGIYLDGAYLTGVDLREANLHEASLIGACLTRAKMSRARIVSVDLSRADLWEVDLTGADITTTNLTGANLLSAKLVSAILEESTLWEANLNRADLTGATLRGANLTRAVLTDACLCSADLSNAELDEAVFSNTEVRGAVFSGAKLGKTHLGDVDLSSMCEALPPVEHLGPSFISHISILKATRSPRLREFLQRAGMPEIFVEYMIDCARSLTHGGIFRMLQSTFISYGGPDTDFAQKVNDALLKNGVTTFFFAKDALPGRKLHRLMREGVNQYDRVILVCSKASLDRPGVLNEISETLQREARDGGKEYLIPITLDDYIFSGWKPEDPGVAQAIKDRVVADFKGADAAPAKFNDGLLRLIAALKNSASAT